MNGYEEEDFVTVSVGDSIGPLNIVHSGHLYEGKRDPSPLFRALANSHLTADDVQISFYGRTHGVVAGLAARAGVTSLVRERGMVSHQEALRAQAGADVLLLLLWDDPREVGVYSGKIFEYLGARRPILMLGYDQGVAASLIRDRDAGVVANTPDRILEALLEWVAEKRQGGVPLLPTASSVGLTRREQGQEMSRLLRELVQ